MRIIQISDSHISLEYPARAENLLECVETINNAALQPDAVIHTGDIVHTGASDEYNIAKEALAQLRAPCYVMAGNKDKRAELIQAFADERHIHSEDEFIQYSIENFPVRLILLDTLCESSNRGELCDSRLAHLQQMLAADASRPSAIFLHHAPFEVPPIPEPQQFENWDDVGKLGEIVAQHPQICGIFCGHIHRNVEGKLGELHAFAISCMAKDLRKGKLSPEEQTMPMLRSIELPSGTHSLSV